VAPFATGTGVTLAGTLLGAAVEGLRVSGPELLLFLGTSAVAGGATLWGVRRGASRTTPAPAVPLRPTGTVVCVRCSNSVPAHEWAEIVRRAWHSAASSPRATPATLSGSAAVPGELLWGPWLPDENSPLSVGLIGPVPETAWIPPTLGALVPFPDREPESIVVRGELVPVVATIPEVTEIETELLRTAEAVAPGKLSSTLAPTPSFPGRDGSSFSFVPDASYDWLTVEALHPIPPHLRAGPARTGAGPPAGPPRPPTPERTGPSCATCSKALPPAIRSRPCPDCQQPVCLTCRTRAVVQYGQTWCGSCASNHRWEDPAPTGRWAPTGPGSTDAVPPKAGS
jgi:hypothetical protein